MIKENNQALEPLRQIVADTAIHHGSDTLKIMSPTGQIQKWLIDLRPVLLNVDALEIITDIFWDRYEEQLPFQIGGMEVAVGPLLTS